MTLGKFVTYATTYALRRMDQRPGQAAFNALDSIRPDLSKKIVGTERDPFYDDERLLAFWKWVSDHWGDQ